MPLIDIKILDINNNMPPVGFYQSSHDYIRLRGDQLPAPNIVTGGAFSANTSDDGFKLIPRHIVFNARTTRRRGVFLYAHDYFDNFVQVIMKYFNVSKFDMKYEFRAMV